MKHVFPEYLKRFKCIADKCLHNCCIGWQICIDKETMKLYKGLDKGRFPGILATVESDGDSHSFKLVGDRCPHLNERGLCEIISRLGDGYICEICREHPRYHVVIGNRSYDGIGLCCESAAELILTSPIGAYSESDDKVAADVDACDEELFEIIAQSMTTIIGILRDDASSILKKLKSIYIHASEMQSIIDGETYEFLGNCDERLIDYFSKLEHLSCELPELMQSVNEKDLYELDDHDGYLCRIAAYFTERYTPSAAIDGNLIGRVSLAILSTMTIGAILKHTPLKLSDAVNVARCYSAEIEYSEDNVDKIVGDVVAEGMIRRILRI